MTEKVVTEPTGDPAVDAALSAYADAAARINALDLTALVRLDGPSTGLHAVARIVEAVRRSMGGFDTGYVTALEVGDEPARYARSTTAVFLRQQLRLSAGEARRRVAVAHACAPRSGLAGEPLPARHPVLAAAIGAGEVSTEHAHLVVAALDALPAAVAAEHGPWVEAELVMDATRFEPAHLTQVVARVLAHLDPDGRLRDHDHAVTQRTLWVKAHAVGAGGTIGGRLSPELLDKLQTVLPALADNLNERSALDYRDYGQRLHDALLSIVDGALNAGDLPACGGTPASTVFHIREDALADRYGLAVTENGNLAPIGAALAVADQSLVHVLIENASAVPLWLGRTTRIATPGQTTALAARDGGCSFPGCTRPPNQCQRHHIRDWAKGGTTDLDNLTLICGYHHRRFGPAGWRVVMVNGHPWWIPPRWLDPAQQPVRNDSHQTYPDTG